MNDIYQKLVDLYADQNLPEELAEQLENEAKTNQTLKKELDSLRNTVETLHRDHVSYTEETHQRILMKIYARGGHLQPQSPEPRHLQYQLPMSG